jgi:hypothetical protein
MGGNLAVKGNNAQLSKRFEELIQEHATFKKRPQEVGVLLISNEMRAALILDMSRFYGELEFMKFRNDARMLLALQLALDNNKCALNVLKGEGRYGKYAKVNITDIEKAREITGVKRIEKPAEYVDSHVSFLVKGGALEKERESKVAETAKWILEKYEEKKGKEPISNPLSASAAAVQWASFMEGRGGGTVAVSRILKISEPSLRDASDRLIEVIRPDDFEVWKGTRSGRSGL